MIDQKAIKIWTPGSDAVETNYTINFYPREIRFIKKVDKFISELKVADPKLYWYQAWQFHLTLLTLIPYETIEDNGEKIKKFETILKGIIPKNCVNGFKFKMSGVSANNSFTSMF